MGASLPDSRAAPGSVSFRRISRPAWMAVAAALAAVVAVIVAGTRPSATQREVARWIRDFQRVQASSAAWPRLPGWPLSFEGQRELVRQFTRPESRIARMWETMRRRIPGSVRPYIPRLPLARDRLAAMGPALIEMPKMPALRLALLEAAMVPGAANRTFAVQFAGEDWPVPVMLLPALERLAGGVEPAVRVQVAHALRGIPPGNPAGERLIGQLQADQVSVVRETARSPYRSDAAGESVPTPRNDAPNP